MHFDFLTTANEVRSDWEDVRPLGEYRAVPSGSLPTAVPAGLREGLDSLVMVSGSNDGAAYFLLTPCAQNSMINPLLSSRSVRGSAAAPPSPSVA